MCAYDLELKVLSPKDVKIGEEYQIMYQIRNIGKYQFPGGSIRVLMFWSSLGSFLVNNHLMEIKELAPDESVTITFKQTDLLPGVTFLQRPNEEFVTSDRNFINLYRPNETLIPGNQVFHTIRVKSKEEVIQARSNVLAIGSVIVFVFLQIIDWCFEYNLFNRLISFFQF